MKAINIDKKNIIYGTAILIVGMFFGWLFFGGNGGAAEGKTDEQQNEQAEKATVWTCSMHPQIKQNKPGQCPLCGMDLIPLEDDSEDASPIQIQMSEAAMRIAEVQTTKVEKTAPYKEVYLPGKVKADERLIISQAAHIPGRIEKMYVNFTGEAVHKGQKLVSIYSPELITAQKEFLEALKSKDTYPALFTSARSKLSYWKLTDDQIATIEQSGEIQANFDFLADYSGIVTKRMVTLGDHVKEGQILFHITNLSHLWVMFDAYESDIPWVKKGDKIQFTIKSIPGRTFTSTVTFIDPVVNPNTRVAYVRTELDNPKNLLKPGMFTSGILKTMLPGVENALVIPKSTILWTGKRAVVYVKDQKKKKPTFEYREIVLGEDAGNYYVVKEGLEEGEEIVTNGVFKIDAAAQLQGKASMMNPAGGKISTGHNHGGMKMDGGKKMDMKKGEDHSKHENMAMETTEFRVSGNCGMCKERIEKAANAVKGVKSAVWDEDSKMLKLLFNDAQTSKDLVSKAIAKVGHSTEFTAADDEAYNALPACCQYSKEEN